MLLIELKNKQITNLLLAYGMDINIRNNIGNTALMEIVENYSNYIWVMKFLIDNWANINKLIKIIIQFYIKLEELEEI